MFNAKVYTVNIPSFGAALEEEHIARDMIVLWNIAEEKCLAPLYLRPGY